MFFALMHIFYPAGTFTSIHVYVILCQVSLAAVNQICVILERLQKSKGSLKDCFENEKHVIMINIIYYSCYCVIGCIKIVVKK